MLIEEGGRDPAALPVELAEPPPGLVHLKNLNPITCLKWELSALRHGRSIGCVVKQGRDLNV